MLATLPAYRSNFLLLLRLQKHQKTSKNINKNPKDPKQKLPKKSKHKETTSKDPPGETSAPSPPWSRTRARAPGRVDLSPSKAKAAEGEGSGGEESAVPKIQNILYPRDPNTFSEGSWIPRVLYRYYIYIQYISYFIVTIDIQQAASKWKDHKSIYLWHH